MNLLRRLLAAIRAQRLAFAEADLTWFEDHAPREYKRRRRVVRLLRRRVARDRFQDDAAAVLAKANDRLHREFMQRVSA